MTDNEIIKALECCARLNKKCNKCPLLNDGAVSEHCISVIRCEVLDLIKRQQAKIAELHEINEGLAMSLLCDVVNKDPDLKKEIVATAEYNAITEFAERLHKKADVYDDGDTWFYFVDPDEIDNLVEEMAGVE
ncbi:MAG: hypothetical protein J6A16_12220 [Oscillospiraceae bacterium]|nr:hypothetical protein [Oscillospiraceae bacterium]